MTKSLSGYVNPSGAFERDQQYLESRITADGRRS